MLYSELRPKYLWIRGKYSLEKLALLGTCWCPYGLYKMPYGINVIQKISFTSKRNNTDFHTFIFMKLAGH